MCQRFKPLLVPEVPEALEFDVHIMRMYGSNSQTFLETEDRFWSLFGIRMTHPFLGYPTLTQSHIVQIFQTHQSSQNWMKGSL